MFAMTNGVSPQIKMSADAAPKTCSWNSKRIHGDVFFVKAYRTWQDEDRFHEKRHRRLRN